MKEIKNKSAFSPKKALFFTSLAHFTNDGNFLLFSLLIVYFSKIPYISITFLGITAIIYNIIYGLVSLPIGKIADKLNKDSFLITLGLFLEGLSAFLFGLVFIFPHSYLVLIIIAAFSLGSGQAFYHPLGASVLSFTHKDEKLGTALGINGAAGSTGRALLPSIITFLILGFGGFGGLGIITVYIWILSIIVYFGLRGFKRVYNNPKKNKKLKVSSEIKSKLYRVVIPVFLKGMFLMGTVTFVAKYLDSIFNSITLTGIILTISFIPAILGQPFFGYFTAKKGGRYIISLTSLLSFIVFGVFLLTKNIYVITASYAVLAFLLFNGFSVLLDYTYQIVPQSYYSYSYSVVWGLGNILGGASGIGLMTLFLYFTNIYNAMVYMLILLFISLFSLPLLPNYIKGKTA